MDERGSLGRGLDEWGSLGRGLDCVLLAKARLLFMIQPVSDYIPFPS